METTSIELIARVQNLCDTEANWDMKTDFIPNNGEFVIYKPDDKYTYPRIKLGDGVNFLKDLPFIDSHKSQVQIVKWEDDD